MKDDLVPCTDIRKVDCDFKHPYDEEGNPLSLYDDREGWDKDWLKNREDNEDMSLSDFSDYYGDPASDETHMPIAKNPQCIIFYNWCEGGDYPVSPVFKSTEDAAKWACMYFDWELDNYAPPSYDLFFKEIDDFLNNEPCLSKGLFSPCD